MVISLYLGCPHDAGCAIAAHLNAALESMASVRASEMVVDLGSVKESHPFPCAFHVLHRIQPPGFTTDSNSPHVRCGKHISDIH